MAKLINIETIRAEIERLADLNKSLYKGAYNPSFLIGVAAGYGDVLSFLRGYEKSEIPINPQPVTETEGERIRKYLVDWVLLSDNPRKNECLAWLEKQKEQNLIMANSPQLKEQKPYHDAEIIRRAVINICTDLLSFLDTLEEQPTAKMEGFIEGITTAEKSYQEGFVDGYSAAEKEINTSLIKGMEKVKAIRDADIDYDVKIDNLQEPEHIADASKMIKNAPKIKGWVARDGDFGHLRLYPSKPWRGTNDYEWGSGYPCMQILDDSLLPEVTFENSPIEVELIIRETK